MSAFRPVAPSEMLGSQSGRPYRSVSRSGTENRRKGLGNGLGQIGHTLPGMAVRSGLAGPHSAGRMGRVSWRGRVASRDTDRDIEFRPRWCP